MPRASYVDAAAADFGRHSKGGGGWALGLEVAACVKPGSGNGDPLNRSRRDHDGLKVSGREFATKSGTSADRVLRFFAAWQRAAEQGLVAPAEDLNPVDWDDDDHIPTGYEWDEFYDASAAGGRPRDSRPEHAAKILDLRGADAVVDELTDDQIEEVVEAAARRRPRPARQGMVRGTAATLPESPFTEPPRPYDGAEDAEAQMNVHRDEAHLHDAIGRIEVHARVRPALLDIGRLESEKDLLATVIMAAAMALEGARD